MTSHPMELTDINGVELELWDRGSGEPVVFVHGSMGDECAAVLVEPALANRFRVIHYHRRGYRKSERPEAPVSMRQQAADCRAVMQYLGTERAHFVGQSYGGAILLQMARDFPDATHSLALLEPALPSVLGNSQAFTETVGKVVALYSSEDKAGAVATFGEDVAGADFRAVFDQTLPPAACFDRRGRSVRSHLRRRRSRLARPTSAPAICPAADAYPRSDFLQTRTREWSVRACRWSRC
jgi:pimeloyl-ACP methyl ester carboxylesterase